MVVVEDEREIAVEPLPQVPSTRPYNQPETMSDIDPEVKALDTKDEVGGAREEDISFDDDEEEVKMTTNLRTYTRRLEIARSGAGACGAVESRRSFHPRCLGMTPTWRRPRMTGWMGSSWGRVLSGEEFWKRRGDDPSEGFQARVSSVWYL